MNPISSSEFNALYATAAAGTDASTAAASINEVKNIFTQVSSAAKGIDTNTLLQQAIQVAKTQAETARAKANEAKALMEQDAQALADAHAYLATCEQSLQAAKDQLKSRPRCIQFD